MDAVPVPPTVESGWVPLVDVSELSIVDLSTLTDPMLVRSLQQVVRSLHDPDSIISAFQSFTT